jgi:hypothetical protein
MKIKKFTISIPAPCTENWNDMTPTERGKFCAHCQKEVIDFSIKTDSEIANFIKQNKGNLCGRFIKSQLGKEYSYIEQEKYSNLKYAAALALGLLTTENAIGQNNNSKTEIINNLSTKRDTIHLQNNTINTNKIDTTNNNGLEVVITAPKNEKRIQGGMVYIIDTVKLPQLPLDLKLIEQTKSKKRRK